MSEPTYAVPLTLAQWRFIDSVLDRELEWWEPGGNVWRSIEHLRELIRPYVGDETRPVRETRLATEPASSENGAGQAAVIEGGTAHDEPHGPPDWLEG